eukprot:gene12420-15617_t
MALLLFRKRSTLRGNRLTAPTGASSDLESGLALFWLLPVFNVLVVELLYQAPWQNLLGPGWNLLCMELDPGSSSQGGDDPGDGTSTVPSLVAAAGLL